MYNNNGMGITPISFQEIKAWSDLTKTYLTPVEVRILKNMSNEFVKKHYDTRTRSVPPNNDWDIEEANRFATTAQRFIQKQKK